MEVKMTVNIQNQQGSRVLRLPQVREKTRLKDTLDRDKKAHDIYYDLIEKPSRSEYDFTLVQQLRWDGYMYEHRRTPDFTKPENFYRRSIAFRYDETAPPRGEHPALPDR